MCRFLSQSVYKTDHHAMQKGNILDSDTKPTQARNEGQLWLRNLLQ
jgi:hypothetical protein